MIISNDACLSKLSNAGLLLTKEFDIKHLISIIVEEAMDLSYCDLSCLYLSNDPKKNNCSLRLVYKKGKFEVPKDFTYDNVLIEFIKENKESIVLSERKKSLFFDLLLNKKMQSGMAFPLIKKDLFLGVLFINSVFPYYFNREKINLLDSFIKLASEIFNYTRLINDLKKHSKK